MRDVSTHILAEDRTVADAIEFLHRLDEKFAIVLDHSGRLRGTITDSDIRRGLLRRLALSEKVVRIMNPDPFCVTRANDPESTLAELRRRQILFVPIVDDDGVLVGAETIRELQSARPNWVVIMAGGEGRRLRPLTENLPKPLIEVGGRSVLKTIVGSLEAHGFHRFFVAVRYKADQIVEALGHGKEFGIEISYLQETDSLGTGGALGMLPDNPSDPIILMNGDILTRVDFGELLRFHNENDAAVTMCVRAFDFQLPYGAVEHSKGIVTHIREKPIQSWFVNAGIYCISPDIVASVKSGTRIDMPSVLQMAIDRGQAVHAFPIHEYWIDIGRLEDLEQAEADFSGIFELGPAAAVRSKAVSRETI